MQHQVPQFIDVEDKIFGPLTAKQFFYLLGGGAVIFIMYVYFQLWFVIVLGAPIAAFAASLAFLKINGRPFINVLAAALSYSSSARLYLWRKAPLGSSKLPDGKKPGFSGVSKPGFEESGSFFPPGGATPKLTQSKLQDLSWSLDIQQKLKR
ncbi:hypothetical protein A2926_02505 [Candidatus Giovannonibacteria bacterium RIFCSPLOWO2_01_FULL_44_40]|uniref:PrgI family protein n=1 Tax=Candidatus Giovannonibacteria bacterium RIFCSPHIGHO2_01_FULL_45_23 TaxID=1798325 RepID=A0A1F5VJB9_9BACT|nr:MAG: hypothetical protein A2834_01510 [Candidatus Giovannonibacteria bacterium RIFCSPHIGHO2_01_FULL_45_23]OGF76824.1 MAG: hypothetical protein A3C77_00280 [Candidatus Giovannonibacteria bacterium RIFCSPHIGHO2_02_FULL_45_13]OGF80230.1 MAG: hypothetical protein A2926_02505 [Candidatus Giovannonibacteria bacterium RIFCSPLOWO2_01_FULL_44_40]